MHWIAVDDFAIRCFKYMHAMPMKLYNDHRSILFQFAIEYLQETTLYFLMYDNAINAPQLSRYPMFSTHLRMPFSYARRGFALAA